LKGEENLSLFSLQKLLTFPFCFLARLNDLIEKSMLKLKRIPFFAFVFFALFSGLSSCANLKIDEPVQEEKPISVFTGKPVGTSLEKLLNPTAEVSSSLPVNALIWRAALDIAAFVPLDDVDTFGGAIVTEWYQSANQPNQRLKLSFFVTGLELRSDAITVQAYLQKRAGDSWVDAGRDDQLARRLEELVLTRARELRAAGLGETTQ
jgi:hypothetical protein